MLSEPQKSLFQGVTADLYRAAIGPRGQDAYLQHFLRFDLEGKTHLTWHWPACCITLNWLIYRKLWRGVLTYVAILLGLVLVIFGVGKLLFDYSNTMGMALLMAFVVAACVVPGLYANIWYYNWCNERISTVLREAKDLKSACAVLAAQASSDRRWGFMALVNGVLILLAAVVLAMVLRKPPPVEPVAEDEVVLSATPAAAASEPARSASDPEPGVAPVPVGSSAALPEPPASVPAPPPEPVAEKLPGPAPVVPPVSAKPAPVKPVAAAKPQADKPRAVADKSPPARGWFVQVGAFSQEANAQKTLATLKAAGLPTTADTQVGKNGRLTRVRVGPFPSEAGAEQAALEVKALELPAVLVKP